MAEAILSTPIINFDDGMTFAKPLCAFECPECGRAMAHTQGDCLTCHNVDCSLYGILYEQPRMETHIVADKGCDLCSEQAIARASWVADDGHGSTFPVKDVQLCLIHLAEIQQRENKGLISSLRWQFL